jgi:DNA adenine methylase
MKFKVIFNRFFFSCLIIQCSDFRLLKSFVHTLELSIFTFDPENLRQSFGESFGNSWGTTVNSSTGGMAQTAGSWKSALNRLPEIHERLQRVQIECSDWRDCLKRYSGPGWLAYCDPPYVHGARKAGGYAHELKDGDHEDLVEALLNYDGAIVLSGYDHSLYKPFVNAGWSQIKIDVVCRAAGRTRASGLQGVGKVLAKQSRTECIWINPEAQK